MCRSTHLNTKSTASQRQLSLCFWAHTFLLYSLTVGQSHPQIPLFPSYCNMLPITSLMSFSPCMSHVSTASVEPDKARLFPVLIRMSCMDLLLGHERDHKSGIGPHIAMPSQWCIMCACLPNCPWWRGSLTAFSCHNTLWGSSHSWRNKSDMSQHTPQDVVSAKISRVTIILCISRRGSSKCLTSFI